MAVSLRLPPELKQRIKALAAARDTTPHAFMLEAIREKLRAEEAALAFRAEAELRLARLRSHGKAIPADEVFEYLRRRVRGETAKRPKARKLR